MNSFEFYPFAKSAKDEFLQVIRFYEDRQKLLRKEGMRPPPTQ